MVAAELTLGIYEKALPADLDWNGRLAMARDLGFSFVEMSIDESDERLARLEWTAEERSRVRSAVARTGVRIPSICLSGHRRFPFGSHDPEIRMRAGWILARAIDLAVEIGVRTIQLAGYDVYYEGSDDDTARWFEEGLRSGIEYAARENVMLAMEIMDGPFMNSIPKYLNLKRRMPSPWFGLYPDLGNLSAWGNDVPTELELGITEIVAIHLKDTHPVTDRSPGQFRDVPFGTGCVDFVAAFRRLGALRYRGPFMIEMWTEKADDPAAEVKEARRWILDRMREGGFLDAE
jgi:hexulose-6-phosphate isomerase